MSIQIQIGADVSGVDKAIDQATKSIDKIRPAAASGAASLNALGQVARDAPFGFIAIQNNLPILFDSLGALTKQAGGVGGALKSLGATLAGPTGITFAIGAVIAGLTALSQKYGSVGEGIKVLLGISKELTESQKAFNKAVFETTGNLNSEQVKVELLTKTLLNQKAPQADRLAAYGELKKIAPDVVAGIRDENALTKESSILIQANATARKELVQLKIQEAGITAALTSNETKLAELRAKLTIADQEYVKSAKELNNTNKQSIITGFASQTQQQSALKVLNDNIASVQELRNQINKLTNDNKIYLDQLDPTINSIAQINEVTRQRIEELKKEDKALKDLTKSEKISLKTKEEQQRVDNLYAAKKKISDQANLNKIEIEGLRKTSKGRRKSEREIGINIPTQLPTIAPQLNNQALLDKSTQAINQLDRLKKASDLSAAYNLMSNTFFSPVENLFSNFLETGKFAFKEFAQSILKAITQIVAKIIATGVVTLLASLFIPGFAAAGGGVGASLLSGITGALGFGGGFGGAGGSRVGEPNFGGVSGGAMQMAGAVNLSLRGSDLVGAINRTNATINRVG
jgi:hypothetical protein